MPVNDTSVLMHSLRLRGLAAAFSSQMANMMRSAAADRNKDAILEVLRSVVPAHTQFNALEAASGSRQSGQCDSWCQLHQLSQCDSWCQLHQLSHSVTAGASSTSCHSVTAGASSTSCQQRDSWCQLHQLSHMRDSWCQLHQLSHSVTAGASSTSCHTV
ncbi:hypothetical protein NP493_709g03016 [Ridgeia piscesae]|uniref:Uncharacterized protein n=1 Tax=Ridgeia piscesae TaxID=27915 RepID=A0AAD9NPE3_RIDPI|nr:hypothetical protein NP493_709g03016 [Ridgeia piscesae]